MNENERLASVAVVGGVDAYERLMGATIGRCGRCDLDGYVHLEAEDVSVVRGWYHSIECALEWFGARGGSVDLSQRGAWDAALGLLRRRLYEGAWMALVVGGAAEGLWRQQQCLQLRNLWRAWWELRDVVVASLGEEAAK